MKFFIIILSLFYSAIVNGGQNSIETRKYFCVDREDNYYTKAFIKIDKNERLLELSIITPEYLWTTPNQPETPQAPEGFSLETPNLVLLSDYRVLTLHDSDGSIRLIDFGPTDPDSIEVEGFSGSIAFHDVLGLTGGTPGSLYYTASGNAPTPVYSLDCKAY